MNDNNQPITGICLVTKVTNVPTGYELIRKGNILNELFDISVKSFL